MRREARKMQSKAKKVLLSEKKLMGFGLTDLLGIAIMVIPFIISILFNHIIPGKRIWFLQLSSDTITNIRPGLISALCAVIFYASLIVRYEGIFRMNNLFEAFVSIVRMFLNCWVIAAIVSLVVPTTIPDKSNFLSVFFDNPESTLLLLAIILSWLGMKTIAGYSWILFIIAAWKHLLIVNSAMNMWGTVFVLSFAISLFLQVRDHTVIGDLAQEFRSKVMSRTETVKDEINAAADDVTQKVETVKGLVMGGAANYMNHAGPSANGAENNGGVRINLDALDMNKDGVVDEKDFLLLQQKKDEGAE